MEQSLADFNLGTTGSSHPFSSNKNTLVIKINIKLKVRLKVKVMVWLYGHYRIGFALRFLFLWV